MGRVPATCLMEPMSLKAGAHEETIQFLIAPKLAEKWNPSIDWRINKWCLRNKVEKLQGVEKPLKVKRATSSEKVKAEPVKLLTKHV